MSEGIRETWATRVGFILAAVGSAVGLGNVWRFPFITGESGGASFLLVYLLFVALVGFPAILVEFVLGRATDRNPVGAMQQVASGAWRYLGWIFIVTSFVIMSYYSVVAGWTIRYTLMGLFGNYPEGAGAAGEQFLSVAQGFEAIAFHALFLLGIVAIVGLGVRRGIETAVKVMVPAIVAVVLGLVVYAFTLEGASEAYAYYLSPDFGHLAAEWTTVLPRAAGQAFFTLSLGMGIMITYASYVGEDRNMSEDAAVIVGFDTLIAFLVGLIVFPILYTAGVDPADPGAGALFISVAGALGEIPLGGLVGAVFFGTVVVAALSSAISLTEVVVSYLIDEHDLDRFTATAAVCGALFVLGIPSAWDIVLLDLFDGFADGILLVLGGLLLAVFVSWFWADRAVDELERGTGGLGQYGEFWIWFVRVPVVVVLLVSLALGVLDYVEFLQTDFADWLGS